MMKLLWALCVFVVWASGVAHSAPSPSGAPAPSIDCSSALLNLADCLDFVQNGSTTAKPTGLCCSGLKSVLKESAMCLCDALKSSSSYGVVLNMTKALDLPSACRVSTPALRDCGTTNIPSGAPEASPSPTSSPTTASISEVPAPAPAHSGTIGLTVSFLIIFVSLVAFTCSSF